MLEKYPKDFFKNFKDTLAQGKREEALEQYHEARRVWNSIKWAIVELRHTILNFDDMGKDEFEIIQNLEVIRSSLDMACYAASSLFSLI